jgi:iron-sulfur cluster assembly protein
MDRTADLGPEHRVDAAVLLDAAQSGELGRYDGRAEVIAASREVGDFCARTGYCGLDAVLQVVGRWHQVSSVAVATLRIVITFTDKGAEKVQEFLASQSADIQTSGLRVGVRGGGCSGFQYALAFDTQRDGDEVFEDHGLRILVDGPSLPYVKGAIVDYVESMQGAGFKVDNPNVIAACGCGSSFRVADEEEVSAV